MLRFFLLTILVWPVTGLAEEICVVNGTNDRYSFRIETRGGQETSGNLIASGRMCVDAASGSKGGRISVSKNGGAGSDCARLIPDNGTEMLLRFAEGDLCTWSSQPRGTRR